MSEIFKVLKEEDLRVIISYRWSTAKKDVIKTVHVCFNENVAQVYEKERRKGTTVALAKDATWCEGCIKTTCWDKGKAICCNERVLVEAV